MRVVSPPIQPDLLGLVDRADDQPDANGEQLDFGQRNFDVSGNDKALVEHAVQQIDKTTGMVLAHWQISSHRLGQNLLSLACSLRCL
jgi:hypothetical protein